MEFEVAAVPTVLFFAPPKALTGEGKNKTKVMERLEGAKVADLTKKAGGSQ